MGRRTAKQHTFALNVSAEKTERRLRFDLDMYKNFQPVFANRLKKGLLYSHAYLEHELVPQQYF